MIPESLQYNVWGRWRGRRDEGTSFLMIRRQGKHAEQCLGNLSRARKEHCCKETTVSCCPSIQQLRFPRKGSDFEDPNTRGSVSEYTLEQRCGYVIFAPPPCELYMLLGDLFQLSPTVVHEVYFIGHNLTSSNGQPRHSGHRSTRIKFVLSHD